jgi:hypothetical protein
MLGIAIPTSIAVMAMGSGAAWAQYTFEGSDTLTEVIRNSIPLSGANLVYKNTGSGQAEKNMVHDTTYFGSPANYYQGIGPMSRNFVGQVIDPLCATRSPATCNTTTKPYMNHQAWAPTAKEVIGLDGAVLSVQTVAGYCLNIDAALQDPTNPAIAAMNSDLAIILGGYNASGTSKATTAECAAPERLAALARLVGCMGINRLDHIYRRDDKSGTQDTWREHLQFPRWCNGKSEGTGNDAVGSKGNLANKDLDPIRRRCVPSDYTYAADGTTVTGGTTAPTTCTYYPLATTCKAGDPDITDPSYGTIKCSQGLVVALSEVDFGSKDITISIGNRVKHDPNGFSMGLAGLASVANSDVVGFVAGTNINSITFEPGNIRNGQYLMARRLFLQGKTNAAHNATVSGDPDTGRDVEESKFYNWVTNRCNALPVVVEAGFLPPLDDCHAPCDDTGNIACVPADPGIGAPKMNVGAEITAGNGPACDASYPCVADGTTTSTGCAGTCAAIPKVAQNGACNVTGAAKCSVSGETCHLNSTYSLLAGTCQ